MKCWITFCIFVFSVHQKFPPVGSCLWPPQVRLSSPHEGHFRVKVIQQVVERSQLFSITHPSRSDSGGGTRSSLREPQRLGGCSASFTETRSEDLKIWLVQGKIPLRDVHGPPYAPVGGDGSGMKTFKKVLSLWEIQERSSSVDLQKFPWRSWKSQKSLIEFSLTPNVLKEVNQI